MWEYVSNVMADGADVGDLMARILFDEWRGQIAANHLTEAGLSRAPATG